MKIDKKWLDFKWVRKHLDVLSVFFALVVGGIIAIYNTVFNGGKKQQIEIVIKDEKKEAPTETLDHRLFNIKQVRDIRDDLKKELRLANIYIVKGIREKGVITKMIMNYENSDRGFEIYRPAKSQAMEANQAIRDEILTIPCNSTLSLRAKYSRQESLRL